MSAGHVHPIFAELFADLAATGQLPKPAASRAAIPVVHGGEDVNDMAFIAARSIPEPNSGCWLWTLYRDRKGYGTVWNGGKKRLAHRVSWEMSNGQIPAGLCALHRCDTPSCVNPDHLFLGTVADNNADMVSKLRQPAGESNGRAKLTEAKVAAIRADTRFHRVIAAECGVSRAQISKIRAGKEWRKSQ